MAITKPESGTIRRELKAKQNQCVPRIREPMVCRQLPQGWRQLHGGFFDLGASIEWQDFQTTERFEWSRSFHPDSLELCLNLAGQGVIQRGKETVAIQPMTVSFYFCGNQELLAWRDANTAHRYVTVGFSAPFLREQLGASDGALHPLVEGFLRGTATPGRLGESRRFSSMQQQLITHLLNPPVPQAARFLWYQGKLMELMAEFFFNRDGRDELFCDRQKRVARERVERVLALLEENLLEPLSLEELGRKVGCSPFHLSRTFSAEKGMTIPQYLRKLRMERAAELLRSGKYNVTEAAFAVGYSSLSHFSQAFCQTVGCCPGLYPLKGPK
jgi:AraC-like DNA-binding protein